jgi:uncharacterized protein (DUF1499 family)
MTWFAVIAAVAAGMLVLVLLAGQAGWLAGKAPSRLGLVEGRLKPPSKTPNSVSSQADLWPDHPMREAARIAPLPVRGDADVEWARLHKTIVAMPGARIVQNEADYLYVQFRTRWLKFIDDAEFWLDRAAGTIHLRSAARVGRKDFGVNRKRIESLRAALATAG